MAQLRDVRALTLEGAKAMAEAAGVAAFRGTA
jgi:hypothetical protein